MHDPDRRRLDTLVETLGAPPRLQQADRDGYGHEAEKEDAMVRFHAGLDGPTMRSGSADGPRGPRARHSWAAREGRPYEMGTTLEAEQSGLLRGRVG